MYIPFRGVGLDFRDNAWFEARIEIFRKYTLQSLAKQTNRDFIIWCSFRPQDRDNPLVRLIYEHIHNANLQCVFTFDGLMYVDDKFGGGIWQTIKNVGRVMRAWWRGQAKLSYVWGLLRNPNETLWKRLRFSLFKVKEVLGSYQNVQKPKKVLLTRIDSDDMFHKEAIAEIKKSSWVDNILLRAGYIYNSTTGELAEWNPPTNPPFHSIIFSNGDFFDPKKHIARYGGYKSHEDALNLPGGKVEVFKPRLFCVTTHDPKNHISTTWNHPFRGKLVDISLINDFI